jgi:hypothetical protein
MTRRRILCGLLLASAVLMYFAFWLWIENSPKTTRARFEQVKKGMSREQVIRWVGGPPGDYSEGRGQPIGHRPVTWDDPKPYRYQTWVGDDAWMLVGFDEDDTVVRVAVQIVRQKSQPTLIERFRRWLGL